MRCIRSVEQLRPGLKVLIYGAGGRGAEVLRAICRDRPDIEVAGFLDSRESGAYLSLPLTAIDDYLTGPGREEHSDRAIVIASSHYEAIAELLRSRGLDRFTVYLASHEKEPLTAAPPERLVARLAELRHPLAAAASAPPPGREAYLNCPWFASMYLRPTGISPCCWIPDLVDVEDPGEALDRHMAISSELISRVGGRTNMYCLKCPSLAPGPSPMAHGKLNNVDIDVSIVCNLECSYCRVVGTHARIRYDFRLLLDHAIDRGYFNDRFSYSFSGAGEPVLNASFAPVLEKLLARDTFGNIHTNAVIYSGLIEKGLRAGRLSIYPSLDAGTRETYRRVRGRNKFEAVWKNLGKYVRANPDNVVVKYILTEDNCRREEISRFVAKCADIGVRKIIISKDFYADTAGDCVTSAAALLAREAKDNSIASDFLTTAFSQQSLAAIRELLAQ